MLKKCGGARLIWQGTDTVRRDENKTCMFPSLIPQQAKTRIRLLSKNIVAFAGSKDETTL